MSQLHTITCEHCLNVRSMMKGVAGIWLVPYGWTFDAGHEFCSDLCRDDYNTGIAMPSTPRYTRGFSRWYGQMVGE